jgi:L-seryl-tRNA(Ser) seleniumtransferase
MSPDYRSIPSVDQLLQEPQVQKWAGSVRRDILVGEARAVIAGARSLISSGGAATSPAELAAAVDERMRALTSPALRRVINATGVVLHTNLGRAPLSEEALRAVDEIARGYSNLEFDLQTGERGFRGARTEQLLRVITGAESALAVNNNAAAVLLALAGLAAGRDVIVSRGQAVEVGGSFRIPDVMKQSGVRLVEVGTTNRTNLRDYEDAITPETALLLQVHPSNFKVIGFTESVETRELAELGSRHAVPVMDDLGSGALLPTEKVNITHERTVQESIQAGAGIVCFSADKLLGGPQAGLIAGRADLVGRLKTHPLMRALRLDKMALAALEVTLLHYVSGEVEQKVPVWRMMAANVDEIRARASRLAGQVNTTGVAKVDVVDGFSTVGGGSLPGESIPTALIRICPADPEIDSLSWAARFAGQLRAMDPPIVGRIEKGSVLLDLRTVFEGEEDDLVRGLDYVLREVK